MGVPWGLNAAAVQGALLGAQQNLHNRASTFTQTVKKSMNSDAWRILCIVYPSLVDSPLMDSVEAATSTEKGKLIKQVLKDHAYGSKLKALLDEVEE